jgi:acyl-CoA synthetase (AMP-forming)/AMP-acid ligase II
MARERIRQLFRALSSDPRKEALVFGGHSFSYGELDLLSRRYARGLAGLGIVKGDRVAVFADASPEVVAALLGHYRLGAVHVPINSRYREREAGHILRDSGACAVLYTPGGECGRMLDRMEEVPDLRLRIALGPGGREGDARFEQLALGEPAAGEPQPEDDDAAVIVYTSGTTGTSKGAALTFRALADNIGALTSAWKFSAQDRLCLSLPLFHVHGLAIGIHGALLHGLTLLLSARFDAGEVVHAFEKMGATVFMGVPTMYVRILEHLSSRPEAREALARGRLFTSGSAPLSAADFEAFEGATGHRILERYGMSETLFTLSNPYEGDRRPGTVGLPVGGCEIQVLDEQGCESRPEESGELWVRSNGIMTGYWNRPEETRAAFRGGWFATGDVARRDPDGYVRLLGRKSVDVIKSGGFKISAREIEDAIAAHPNVREVAVVGAPDRVWGERIVAAVVLRAAADAREIEREIAELCSRGLADYKRPKEVRVFEELPRNALGKVQKHRILEGLLRTS